MGLPVRVHAAAAAAAAEAALAEASSLYATRVECLTVVPADHGL
jgi:hypothetical protein